MSAVFTDRGGALMPSPHARGPWSPYHQHGGAPAALAARAVERLASPVPMVLSRLTVEFLGPVPLAPLTVEAEVVRPGRRLQLAEATVLAEGEVVCRARAVRLRSEVLAVPDHGRPGPEIAPPDGFAGLHMPVAPHSAPQGFGQTAMELRFAAGSLAELGPATAWFRLTMPMVEGEEPSAAQRAVAAADFGNGISAELRFGEHVFVNTDLTVHLARPPAGEWVAVQARTVHGPGGTAVASSVLHDVHGPVGVAAQTLYVAAA